MIINVLQMTNSAFQGVVRMLKFVTAKAHTRQDKFNIYKKKLFRQVAKNAYPCSKQLEND